MRTFFSILLICILSGSSMAQKTFTGFVIDRQTGKPLSNANIQIKNTYRGTITNEDGRYKITINKLPATLVVTYIGYMTKRITFTESSPLSINIKMTPTIIQLKPITITEEDPAIDIMRKVIEHKKRWLTNLKTYKVKTYSRVSLENDTSIVSIAESNSVLFYDKKRGSKEVIISRKGTSNITDNENFAFASNIQNLYDNDIDIAGFKAIGVTNPKALKYYNFILTGYRTFNGKTLYDIKVEPKSKLQPVMKGRISVVDEDYALVDVDLVPSESIILPPPFQNFDIHYKQQFRKFGNLYWMPVDMRLNGSIKLGMVGLDFPNIIYKQVSVFTEYKINCPLPDSLYSTKKSIIVDSLAIRQRQITDAPVPLTEHEESAYQNLDSTMTMAKAFKPTGFLAKYVVVEASNDAAEASTKEKEKKKKKKILSLLRPAFTYNRVTGAAPGLGISISKKHFKLNAGSKYYFGQKKYAWSVNGEYNTKHTTFSVSVFSKAMTRYSALNCSEFINSSYALMGVTDYYDYFLSKGINSSIKFKTIKFPARLTFGVDLEKHSSLDQTTYFTLAGKDKIDRINPLIDEGNLNSVKFNLTLGHDLVPFSPIGQNSISFKIEHSSPDLMASDFDFTTYRVQGNFRIVTFLKRRMIPPSLDVQFTAGTYRGTLPVQKIGIIETSVNIFTPFGTFKTLKDRPIEGGKYAAVFAEHNFRTLPFEILGLRCLAKKSIGLIVFGAAGKTWMPDYLSSRISYTPRRINSLYSEAGFSINGLFGIARLDFAVPLTRKGFYTGISVARLF